MATDRRKPAAETAESLAEKKASEPKKFRDDDPIRCRSCTPGLLTFEGSKSNNVYRFMGINDVLEIDYKDVLSEVRSRSEYISRPMFVVEDEDFIEQNPYIKTLYEDMYPVEELEAIFDLAPSHISRVVNELPDGVKRSVESMAATKIKNGEIDSIKMIRTLEEIFDRNFGILADDGE